MKKTAPALPVMPDNWQALKWLRRNEQITREQYLAALKDLKQLEQAQQQGKPGSLSDELTPVWLLIRLLRYPMVSKAVH